MGDPLEDLIPGEGDYADPEGSSADADVVAAEEAAEIVEDIMSDSSDYNLVDLSKVSEITDPLNPKTFKNLSSLAGLQKTFGKPVQGSAINNPRYISLQAYNWQAFLDTTIPNDAETGLVIKVTKKPENGTGWDQAIQLEDITQYNANNWAGNIPPNDSLKLSHHNVGDHLLLKYTVDAFNVAANQYNIPENNGLIELQIKVHFQSSANPQVFTIKAPVGTKYSNLLNYGGLSANSTSVLIQQVHQCSNSATNTITSYTKGANILGSSMPLSSTYGILTRYKPVFNPGNSMGEIAWYNDYQSPSSNTGGPSYFLINPMHSVHNDWLTSNIANPNIIRVNSTPPYNGQKQELHRIDVLLQNNNNSYLSTIGGMTSSDFASSWISIGNSGYYDIPTNPGDFNLLTSTIQNQQHNQLFTYTVYYAENIPDCTVSPAYTYDVCTIQGNPSNYLSTSLDCNGNTIPSSHLPGGAIYNTGVVQFNSGECCTACTLELNASVAGSNYQSNDGAITWDVKDVNGVATGNSWGTGSMYTVTVTPANSNITLTGTAAPTGGNTVSVATTVNDTAGTANTFTLSSNAQIVTGMKIQSGHTFYDSASGGSTVTAYVGQIYAGNLSQNATAFYLVDIDNNPVYSQSDATPTLVFITGISGKFGALAPNTTSNPYYTLCVKDEDSCEECTTLIVQEKTPPRGCTDNTAVNYDSTAVQDDGSCILCDSTDGLLHDPLGNTVTSPLFDTLQWSGESATWNTGYGTSTTHNSDGKLSVSAAPTSAVTSYITWDSNSYFEIKLYKTVNISEASTASGATLIATQNTGTLNNVSIAQHEFTGLAYGYYTMRVRYVDTNSVSTLENCWTEWHGIVQAEICNSQASAQYMTVPMDLALRDPQNALLCGVISCCTLDPIYEDTSLWGVCEPILTTNLECSPSRTVLIQTYYSSDNSTWTLVHSESLGVVSGSITYDLLDNVNNYNLFTVNGTGYYKVKIEAETVAIAGAPTTTCYEEVSGYFTVPVSGCMDQTAYNFDPNAVCPGPCIPTSWDCINGACIDPGTGLGQYPTEDDCDNFCVPLPTYGCTDPCAYNYDATADTDDGSCTYLVCTDPNASNQYQNCCNSNYYTAMTEIAGTDNTCCILPCPFEEEITAVTTDSTSTCTTFNNDGSIAATFTNNNGAPTWNFFIYDAVGTTLIYTDTANPYSSGTTTANTYSLLGSGVYTARVESSLGCVAEEQFTIGSTSPNTGCTNPDADNYDPNAVCDDGSCVICGCPDPNANNYNPNATSICECLYDIDGATACVPDNAVKFIEKTRGCLTLKGTDWLYDYKLGRASDCPLMDKWKLILIEYLLTQDKEGLDCLYNCADYSILQPSAIGCEDQWIQGGPSTGLNHDPNHKGAYLQSGGGTVVTSYDNYPDGWYGYVNPGQGPNIVHPMYTGAARSNITYVGDMIKWELPTGHPLASTLNGTIWELTTTPPGWDTWNTMQGHQGCNLQKIEHYTICGEYKKIDVTETTNYYENFLNFVNKFCRDCNINILNKR